MPRTKLLGLALVATLPLAGCTADSDPRPAPAPAPAPGTGGTAGMRLVAFDSCDRLTAELREAAKAAVGPWGLDNGPGYGRAESMAGGARTMADQSAAAPATAFSGTNVHEQGADEPDIVKTDGRRIVTVSGGALVVVDAASRRQTGRLSLGAVVPGDLLLSGDRALVLTSYAERSSGREFAPPAATPEILLVDLTGAPKVLSRFRGQGRVVDARQTGGTARIVLSTAPRIVFPELSSRTDNGDRIAANRKVIDKTPADAWLPTWEVTTGNTTTSGRMACGDVRRPATFSGRTMLSVLTFDLTAPRLDNGRPVALVADGDTVYATPASLYVANDQRWRLSHTGAAPPRDTEIYRFDTTGTQPPVYAAAGSVPGSLLNQYALSEWDGHLRVATTSEASSSSSSSAVRVLRRSGDKLTQVGVVDGLGRGERIYSVRFIGPRGYVVTFRQTDPLYSLDLRDPAKPRVTGELKITGYSAHLQPVGADRLIGIGQEASTEGRVQGTQISLFDVADPAAPKRLAQQHVTGGRSEAEYDPHAILWWPATGLLVVPMSGYGEARNVPLEPSALALRVSRDGLTETGSLRQPAVTSGYRPQIRRTLVVGATLWTLSDAGLQAVDLATLRAQAFIGF